MKALKATVIALCVAQVFLGVSLARAGPPRWQGNAPTPGAIPRSAVRPAREPFKAQCPTAYWGIKGNLLPTYWKAADKAQPAVFLKSQVLDQYLYCVYRIPSEGREVHVSVNRLIPEGYDCISDGAGRFECR